MSGDRDNRGRFTPGNQAGKRSRRKAERVTTSELIRSADKFLAGINQEKTRDQAGRILAGLIGKARAGNVTASTWILDRVAPREAIRLSVPLPSPTADPLAFLDGLADRVSDGNLTVDQAAKLANLARPLIADAELVALRDQVAELVETVTRLERTRLQAIDR